MQIDPMFTGAYRARQAAAGADFRQVAAERSEEIAAKAAPAIQEIKERRGAAVSVSISPEAKAFLCSDEAYQKMKSDTAELYAKNAAQQQVLAASHAGGVFWGNTGNQWLIFSERLDKGGFYDAMSDEEVREVETTLAKITAGMDHLSRTQFNTGMDFSDLWKQKGFFTSAGAAAELDAAEAALRDFGERYVPEGQRADFQKLIEAFRDHNAAIIQNYRAPAEEVQKAGEDMRAGVYQHSALNAAKDLV